MGDCAVKTLFMSGCVYNFVRLTVGSRLSFLLSPARNKITINKFAAKSRF